MFGNLMIVSACYVLVAGSYKKGRDDGEERQTKVIAKALAKQKHGIANEDDIMYIKSLERMGERCLGIK